jgi:T-complex protein 1 subunit theta
MTRTSLGPNGMNKIIINHIGKQFLTKDTSTVLKELDIHHPAAKLIVNSVKMQELEIGDNTNYVATLAGELLKMAESLIKSGLNNNDIIKGFELGTAKAISLLTENPNLKTVTNLKDQTEISKFISSVIGTKLLHSQESFLAPKIAEACISILPTDPKNFNEEYVRVAKLLGGSLLDSSVVKGLVVIRNVEGSVSKVEV